MNKIIKKSILFSMLIASAWHIHATYECPHTDNPYLCHVGQNNSINPAQYAGYQCLVSTDGIGTQCITDIDFGDHAGCRAVTKVNGCSYTWYLSCHNNGAPSTSPQTINITYETTEAYNFCGSD